MEKGTSIDCLLSVFSKSMRFIQNVASTVLVTIYINNPFVDTYFSFSLLCIFKFYTLSRKF